MGQTRRAASGSGVSASYAKKIIHIERSFNMIYSHEVEMMCPVGVICEENHTY